jgi:hypothetical protein
MREVVEKESPIIKGCFSWNVLAFWRCVTMRGGIFHPPDHACAVKHTGIDYLPSIFPSPLHAFRPLPENTLCQRKQKQAIYAIYDIDIFTANRNGKRYITVAHTDTDRQRSARYRRFPPEPDPISIRTSGTKRGKNSPCTSGSNTRTSSKSHPSPMLSTRYRPSSPFRK